MNRTIQYPNIEMTSWEHADVLQRRHNNKMWNTIVKLLVMNFRAPLKTWSIELVLTKSVTESTFGGEHKYQEYVRKPHEVVYIK